MAGRAGPTLLQENNMSNLSEDAARLLGLIEGCGLDLDSKEGKVISKLADIVYKMAAELSALRKDHEELDDYVESIDNDLSDLEEAFFDGQEEDEDEDDEDEDDRTVEYSCPHCGSAMSFSIDDFDFDEDYLCPSCHKPLFPETPEDELEDGDDGDDSDEDN